MANSKSALKRVRQNERARARNKIVRSRIRTFANQFDAAVENGNVEEAESAYRVVVATLDRAARKGVIPKERASRKKGRMAKRLDALS